MLLITHPHRLPRAPRRGLVIKRAARRINPLRELIDYTIREHEAGRTISLRDYAARRHITLDRD